MGTEKGVRWQRTDRPNRSEALSPLDDWRFLAASKGFVRGVDSLMGVVMDRFHSPQIALWIFAACLLLSCLLVLALPARTVNR